MLVVGAGPAGSATALRLARGGASVLLVDKARFPRDKPCGGGLTGRALAHLPCDVSPVVEHVVDRFELGLGYRRRFERRSAAPLVLMTQRRRLDAFLAEQAAGAGAVFRDGVTVENLTIGPDGASATVAGTPVEARVVVGADGANGTTAKAAELGGGIVHGVALEGNAAYGDIDAGRYRGKAVVEVGVVPGGYGWVFPKGDHANFGVGGWASEGPRLRGHLDRLCRAHGLDPALLTSVRGHRLPMRELSTDMSKGLSLGPVLLVGDAAGLVDPLSGDGMYEALVSAELAAAAILAGRPETYAAALGAALDAQALTSWRAKHLLDRHPRLAYEAMRLPPVWNTVAGLLRGELAGPSEAGRLARPPLRALARLARI